MNKKLLASTLTALILCFGIYSLLTNYKLNNASTKPNNLLNPSTTSPSAKPDKKPLNNGADSDDVHTSTTKPIDTDLTSITLFVNKEYPIPSNYVPSDLVVPNIKFSFDYYDEKKQLREEAARALEQLFAASEENGLKLRGVSAYRSYKRQKSIYESNLRTKGLTHTSRYSAKPGYSEHQTGLAIDISTPSIGNSLTQRFGRTLEGIWLAQNCHKYGFIIRYPENKEELTGYSYEPWHIRYVGVDVATYLTKNNLTLEEYYGYTPSTDIYDNGVGSYDTDTNDKVSLPTIQPTKKPITSPPTVAPEVPNATETPDVSEKPEVPENPPVSEKPETPENPSVSEKPETPENPPVSEKPETPENPPVSEKPETPEEPPVSEKPEVPEIPELPETPEAPPVSEKPEVPEPTQTPTHSESVDTL